MTLSVKEGVNHSTIPFLVSMNWEDKNHYINMGDLERDYMYVFMPVACIIIYYYKFKMQIIIICVQFNLFANK